MKAKVHKGNVFGAVLTNAEKKAMTLEINRQIAERDEQYSADIDAMVLYTLMAHYGWKRKRLRRFWEAFIKEHKQLREHYMMEAPGDNEWLAHRKLKEIGVDIYQWYEEDIE